MRNSGDVVAHKSKVDGRLGEALCRLVELGELRRAKKPRAVWAVPAESPVRTLARTKFTEAFLRNLDVPDWAIAAILRERNSRHLRGARSA